MGFRALTHVLQGICPPVEPGELIPETYTNTLGDEESVDFERLVELGAAEPDDGGAYAELKVPALKQLAEDRGIALDGKPTKAALVEALQAADAQLAAEPDDGEPDPDAGEPDPAGDPDAQPPAE